MSTKSDIHLIKSTPILDTNSSSALHDLGWVGLTRFTPVYEGAITAITSANPGVVTCAALTAGNGTPVYFLNSNHSTGMIDYLSTVSVEIGGKAGTSFNLTYLGGAPTIDTSAISAWAAGDGGVISTNWVGYRDHNLTRHTITNLVGGIPTQETIMTNSVLVSNVGPVNMFVQQSSLIVEASAGVMLQPGSTLQLSVGDGCNLRVYDHTATARYSITSFG